MRTADCRLPARTTVFSKQSGKRFEIGKELPTAVIRPKMAASNHFATLDKPSGDMQNAFCFDVVVQRECASHYRSLEWLSDPNMFMSWDRPLLASSL